MFDYFRELPVLHFQFNLRMHLMSSINVMECCSTGPLVPFVQSIQIGTKARDETQVF